MKTISSLLTLDTLVNSSKKYSYGGSPIGTAYNLWFDHNGLYFDWLTKAPAQDERFSIFMAGCSEAMPRDL